MPKIPESLARLRLAGKPLEFFLVDGIVLSNQKWSESHTYSSGVGSFHNTAIGYIALPQIKSYAVENQEIWLRLEIGKDVSCRYSGQTIPVTTGQSISLIAMVIKENAYANVAIANHSTGLWHIIGDLEWLVQTRFCRKPFWGKTFAVAVVGWLILGFGADYAITGGASATKAAINSSPMQAVFGLLIRILPQLPGATDRGESLVFYLACAAFILLLLPPVYALWRHVRRYRRFRRTANALASHLGSLAQAIL